ncbi:hypothetical protein VNO77_27182 [Canavalia gladiata]|uniref:Uncharacterized protein n=1 Tax=Canavalia gladiata TaxID=3824 RepID=A0AAN9KXD6_CANGL
MQAQVGRSTYVSADILSSVPDPGATALAAWYRVVALVLNANWPMQTIKVERPKWLRKWLVTPSSEVRIPPSALEGLPHFIPVPNSPLIPKLSFKIPKFPK